MSLEKIHLRKLLKIFDLPDNKLTSLLREDIRRDIAKEKGDLEGGGDFHTPFWSDAKSFVLDGTDLYQLTNDRVDKNFRRKRLYPALHDGFMYWWNNKKRFNNSPLNPFPTTIKSSVNIEGCNTEVKIENFLGVSIDGEGQRLIYPYFSENPTLSDENARIGLWLISNAFAKFPIEDFRILDVLRGKSFSMEEYPFKGTEKRNFDYNLQRVFDMWEWLKNQY